MEENVFEVRLQLPFQSGNYSLRVDAESLALLIRDAIRTRSPGFIFPARFEVKVKQSGELASAAGEIGWHMPEKLDGITDELEMFAL